jgi:hypothetical protein
VLFAAGNALARGVIGENLRARCAAGGDRADHLPERIERVGGRARRCRPRADDRRTGLHRAFIPVKGIAARLCVRTLHTGDTAHLPQQVNPVRIGQGVGRGRGRRSKVTLKSQL